MISTTLLDSESQQNLATWQNQGPTSTQVKINQQWELNHLFMKSTKLEPL